MLGDISQAVAKPLLQILGFLCHLSCQVQLADRTQTIQTVLSSCIKGVPAFWLEQWGP